ncbi:hypothetical protein LPB41_13045 [Thalassospira sp. MA62]|nr:hypothetical protein [Thalassospira sp. MA62]
MSAVIHVKLTGEGDFGPVDLECAIPPARLPMVMAALFGSPPMQTGAGGARNGATATSDWGGNRIDTTQHSNMHSDATGQGGDWPSSETDINDVASTVDGGPSKEYGFGGMEPGLFLSSYMGSLGDLVGRLHPRGFAETILIAAIWLHYRDGRRVLTRHDIRKVLQREKNLRMPRNFSRDFQVAIERGYLSCVENDTEFAVDKPGYQWFQRVCI